MRKNAAHSIANIPLGLGDPTRMLSILLNEYEAQFTAGRGTSSALDELARARQKTEETIHAWAGRYRGLYRRAHPNYPDQEESLEFIKKWIMGLYNDEVRNWTLKLPQKTLIEAIETANRAESGAHMDQMVKRSINGINEVGQTSERQNQNMMETGQGLEYMGPNPGTSRRGSPGGCWQCGRQDHLIRDCKQYQLAVRNNAKLRGNRNNQRQNFQPSNSGMVSKRLVNQNLYRRGPPPKNKFPNRKNYNQRPQRGVNEINGETNDQDQDPSEVMDLGYEQVTDEEEEGMNYKEGNATGRP